jgi:hypothetical protein
MKLYHLTPRVNLGSILKKGIRCAAKTGAFGLGDKQFRSCFVWLTDDPDYILRYQVGDIWARKNKIQIIELCNVGNVFQMHSWATGTSMEIPHEFVSTRSVPPQNIVMVRPGYNEFGKNYPRCELK